MKILHLSTTDIRGGAARGAYSLHRALQADGIDSQMLVGRRYGDDDDVHVLGGACARLEERVRGALDQLPLHPYDATDESFWTVGWVPRRLREPIAEFDPDIVHLHWTGGGFVPIEALRDLPYPLVWTLRDMWAFTGGCHYTAGCMRYAEGCGHCPQLRSDRPDDLSRRIWKQKEKDWRDLDLWLVGISNWLADCARDSVLFETTPIHVIPNGIDARRFRPVPRDEARASLDLAPDRQYILFGAIGALDDQRKGLPQFTTALEQLAGDCWSTRAEVLVFGDPGNGEAPALGLPTRYFGHIDDDEKLARLYAAADVMVAPSLQEAFGKTLVEAMACATPVVAFDSGGPGEIVDHRATGYLAQPFDPSDLARGIAWCLEDRERAGELGRKARERVDERYDIQVVAQSYAELYRRILARVP